MAIFNSYFDITRGYSYPALWFLQVTYKSPAPCHSILRWNALNQLGKLDLCILRSLIIFGAMFGALWLRHKIAIEAMAIFEIVVNVPVKNGKMLDLSIVMYSYLSLPKGTLW